MVIDEKLTSYDPLHDPNYMSPQMLNYFKTKLEHKLKTILNKEEAISTSLVDHPNREPDHVDQGTNEEIYIEDFAFQEHENHLRHEVELALRRIQNGTYGYCEETGEPIGLKRLMAVPYALYSIGVQERKEREKAGAA